MALTNSPGEAQQKAAALNEAGLKAFADWEMDKAIESFKQSSPGLRPIRQLSRCDAFPG
jgi:hypothetical protein